ncbi:hypothetical protein B0H17DRAFT_1063400 [Mycena rosella]|uniref:Uncharacterized protein n=1 Tax=Mycena rosella TaxID=1033263 RepID=A0AAD7DIW6_MYCRO|nr:hypothetical protein B0H17DRAFT_1063400 [Mycena rosella]
MTLPFFYFIFYFYGFAGFLVLHRVEARGGRRSFSLSYSSFLNSFPSIPFYILSFPSLFSVLACFFRNLSTANLHLPQTRTRTHTPSPPAHLLPPSMAKAAHLASRASFLWPCLLTLPHFHVHFDSGSPADLQAGFGGEGSGEKERKREMGGGGACRR